MVRLEYAGFLFSPLARFDSYMYSVTIHVSPLARFDSYMYSVTIHFSPLAKFDSYKCSVTIHLSSGIPSAGMSVLEFFRSWIWLL